MTEYSDKPSPIPSLEPAHLYGGDVTACMTFADAAIVGASARLLATEGHFSELMLAVSDDELLTVSRNTDPKITTGAEYLVKWSEADSGITTEIALSTEASMRQPVASGELWSVDQRERIPATGEHLEDLVKEAIGKIPRALPVNRDEAVGKWQDRSMGMIGGVEADQVWASIEQSIAHLLLADTVETVDKNPRTGVNWARPDDQDWDRHFPISSFMTSWDNDARKEITAGIMFAESPLIRSDERRLYVTVKHSLQNLQEVTIAYESLHIHDRKRDHPLRLVPMNRALIHTAIAVQLAKDNLRHHVGREK